MIEMTIDSLRVGMMNPKAAQHGTPYVVLLKEKAAERYLPIFIGPAEANAIAIKLRGEQVPRPLTHDLVRSIIDGVGASLDSVIVSDLRNDTFYAKVVLNVNGGQMVVDSRPSDAFALALTSSGVPIFADKEVMEKAGICLTHNEGEDFIVDGQQPNTSEMKTGKVSEEEIGKLSAFSDFLNSLDLEDFGKHKS
ncbi:MAG: bifunctional nuclease family protein [Dehalococcoidia bacterium]|nr:bifunctional nuclease family protein [Dehalococcoidia bacterium]